MDRPLLISTLIEHAARQFGKAEIVSRETHGAIHRYTYADAATRSRRLAGGLKGFGITYGTRVATLAWNNHRHLEAYFAVSGSGAVLHTCNPRLHPEQLAYILNDAEDVALLFDPTFLPLVEAIALHCPKLLRYVMLTDRAHMPETTRLTGLMCYEDLLAECDDPYSWPEFGERALLHVGHDGQPKGGALLASVDRPAKFRAQLARHVVAIGTRVRVAHCPNVPCQRVGHSLRGRHER